MKKRCAFSINRKRFNLGKVLLVSLLVLGAAIGLLSSKLTNAFEGDPSYWSETSETGLTITLVSVEQYGAPIEPDWSNHIYSHDSHGFGNYYFQVANNSDPVRVGVLVDGMADGTTYRIFDSIDLTSENNGQIVYEDLKPHVSGYSMQDSRECEFSQGQEHCYVTPLANEYVLGITLYSSNWSDRVDKEFVVRPTVVGSQNIEILSVKQGTEDLYLDTTGWQITEWEETETTLQTINEYVINDYETPVTISYKLKNLQVGEYYSYSVGNEYNNFKADATEITETTELRLNMTKKHLNSSIQLYKSGSYGENDNVPLYFRIADNNFVALGDIIVAGIYQGGSEIEPTVNSTSNSREYSFNVNDAQSLTVMLFSTQATDNMNYYISYNIYGDGVYLSSEAPLAVTGVELSGAPLIIPALYGLSEESPLTLNLRVNTVGTNYGYDSQFVFYQDYPENRQNSDAFRINLYEDENVPRYDASIFYSNGQAVDSDVIDAKYHDATHPLTIRIEGERYNNEQNYNINAKVKIEGEDEYYYTTVFHATGAELNAGKSFVVDDLALELPVFDPSGSSSGYDLTYIFSLEIDGLEQKGEMYYIYDGWISPLITYNGGEVAAMGNGGGIGGGWYMTSTGYTARKSSLSASNGAVIHYLGGAFDSDMSYNYAIYYNDNAGEDWWSAPAGTKVEEGVIAGEHLNNGLLTKNLYEPSNEADSALYTLVISKNGGIVMVSKDFIRFTNDPQIESFKFTADSDSFMQIGRQSYRVAKDTDITASVTGSGFDNAENYKLWISYEGYHEVENPYGDYTYPEPVELPEGLNTYVTVTGATLNSGYDYILEYQDEFDGLDWVDVTFDVTDMDSENPNTYGSVDEGHYSGHTIQIEYVNEEDVFRGEGYQINENSEVINVSEPEQPGEVIVDVKTPGDVDVIVDGANITVVSRKPVLVIGYKNSTWSLVETVQSVDNDGEKTNSYNLEGFEEVKVVLKGDLNMNGSVNARDTSRIDYYLLANDNPNHIDLSPLEIIIADVNNSGTVTARDASLLDYALLSGDNPNYRALSW